MPVRMRGKRVGVEQVGKTSNTKTLLAMPEDASAVGIIRYVGHVDSHLQVGVKVYFGKNHHQLRINGANILVMDEDNVYAIVEDDCADDKQKVSS